MTDFGVRVACYHKARPKAQLCILLIAAPLLILVVYLFYAFVSKTADEVIFALKIAIIIAGLYAINYLLQFLYGLSVALLWKPVMGWFYKNELKKMHR